MTACFALVELLCDCRFVFGIKGNVSPEEEDNAQMEADDSVGIQDEAVDSGVVSEAPVNPIGSRNQEIENSDNATLGDLVHSDNILEGVDQQLPVVTVIPAGDRCKELLGSMVQASQQVGNVLPKIRNISCFFSSYTVGTWKVVYSQFLAVGITAQALKMTRVDGRDSACLTESHTPPSPVYC